MPRLIDSDALMNLYAENEFSSDMGDAMEMLDHFPTVDAVPVRHGKWIYGNDFHWYTASCSECGYQRRTDIKAANWNAWKYCPMCGARMDEE